MKTVKINIRAFDNSLIGQRLVFDDISNGITSGVIIAVTKDRVIYIDDDGHESWSWIHPNGQRVSFSVLKTDSNGTFVDALELQKAFVDLKDKYKKQSEELSYIKSLFAEMSGKVER